MFYGRDVWDPVLIIAQIISVQCLFYFSLGLLQIACLGPAAVQAGVSHLLDWRQLQFHTRLGWLELLAHCANSLPAALSLMWVVERAKKCLDFSATAYLIHLVVCCSYAGFPRSLTWWATNLCAFSVTALLGEWLCVRREMQDIPLTSMPRNRKESGSARAVPPADDAERPSLLAGATGTGRRVVSASRTTAVQLASISAGALRESLRDSNAGQRKGAVRGAGLPEDDAV